MNIAKYQFMEIHPTRYVEPDKAKCLWVLSTGRCGTLTLSSLLNLSPDIVSFHEPYPRLNRHCNAAYWGDAKGELLDELVLSSRIDLISMINDQDKLYAECNYRFGVYCWNIKQVFKKARFIWLTRSLDDFVRSACNWGWYDAQDERFGPGRIMPKHSEPSRSRILAWYYCSINFYFQQFVSNLPKESYLYLPFTDLLTGDVDHVFRWMGCEAPKQNAVQTLLAQKLHAGKLDTVEKDWMDFDASGAEVTKDVA